MRLRYLSLPIVLFSLGLSSCIEELDYPVETCTFSILPGNDTNPNTTLYQEILDEAVIKGLPGVSVAIHTPEYGWWIGSAGVASLEEQKPLQPCNLFHSASLVKPMTATLILKLYEDGKLQLDDPISEYLPGSMVDRIPNGEAITIKHLLTHTSGLDNAFFDYKGNKAPIDLFNNPDQYTSIDYMLENYLYDRPVLADPGEEVIYSSNGFALLGMIIEEVSEMSFLDFFQQEISDPLGLTSTFHGSSPVFPDEIPELVNGYFEAYPGQLQNCSDIDNLHDRIAIGYAGLISTPYEFARIYREILRGNILDPATVELIQSDERLWYDDIYVSLGFLVIRQYEYGDAYGHGGTYYGTSARSIYFPESDIGIAFLTNLGSVFESDKTRDFKSTMQQLVHVTFTGNREGN